MTRWLHMMDSMTPGEMASSADYLLKNGIHKIVVIGERLSIDLKKILYAYQKKKIQIYLQKGFREAKKVKIHKQRPVDL